MNVALKVPPKSKHDLTPPEDLVTRFRQLLGAKLRLTGKTRTDGSELRNLVCEVLDQHPFPPAPEDYRIIPPKRKGVPRILRELLDTYIVTTGASYNLQVWNRIPTGASVLVEYATGQPLLTTDVRYVLIRVEPESNQIRSVAILTPDYIESRFGRFGKPTIKHQLMISQKARAAILSLRPPLLFYADLPNIAPITSRTARLLRYDMHAEPQFGLVLCLDSVARKVARVLIGKIVQAGSTKNRGQALEEIVARALGYRPRKAELLAGGYPDIRHQALEVKIQDGPTVDLGRFSPQFEEAAPSCPGFTTASIRCLIALTDSVTGLIQGAVICPGLMLGRHFAFVAETNFKCQRSIPMEFFGDLDGRVVFNP